MVRLSGEERSILPNNSIVAASQNAGELPEEFDPLEAAMAGIKAAESTPLLMIKTV